MKKKYSREKGFTLIEMLIALSISTLTIVGIAMVFTNFAKVSTDLTWSLRSLKEANFLWDSFLQDLKYAKSFQIINEEHLEYADSEGNNISVYAEPIVDSEFNAKRLVQVVNGGEQNIISENFWYVKFIKDPEDSEGNSLYIEMCFDTIQQQAYTLVSYVRLLNVL